MSAIFDPMMDALIEPLDAEEVECDGCGRIVSRREAAELTTALNGPNVPWQFLCPCCLLRTTAVIAQLPGKAA